MMPKVSGISALNGKETVMASYEAGCDVYVWKPIDFKKFYELLRNLI